MRSRRDSVYGLGWVGLGWGGVVVGLECGSTWVGGWVGRRVRREWINPLEARQTFVPSLGLR